MLRWLRSKWRQLTRRRPPQRIDQWMMERLTPAQLEANGRLETVNLGELMLHAQQQRKLLMRNPNVTRVEVGLLGKTIVLTVYTVNGFGVVARR